MPTIDLKDKIKGCILGSAIGDALGYTVEFSSMADIRKRFGPQGVNTLRLTKHKGAHVALYSDDTQMARAVAEGLLRAGRDADLDASANEVAEDFINWSQSPDNNRSPGSACLHGCRELAAGTPWRDAGGRNDNSGAGGCGSVMRSHPYGLFFADDEERAIHFAAEHSRMTHGAPLAQAASAALAAGAWSALRDHDDATIASRMQAAAYRYDEGTGDMLVIAEALANDATKPTADVLDLWRGWAGHEAIAAALFVFLRHSSDPKTAHSDVVIAGANSPGDSDSIAAIAGAIVGARYGFASLRPEWVMGIEKSAELQNLSLRIQRALTATHFYLLETPHVPYPDEPAQRPEPATSDVVTDVREAS